MRIRARAKAQPLSCSLSSSVSGDFFLYRCSFVSFAYRERDPSTMFERYSTYSDIRRDGSAFRSPELVSFCLLHHVVILLRCGSSVVDIPPSFVLSVPCYTIVVTCHAARRKGKRTRRPYCCFQATWIHDAVGGIPGVVVVIIIVVKLGDGGTLPYSIDIHGGPVNNPVFSPLGAAPYAVKRNVIAPGSWEADPSEMRWLQAGVCKVWLCPQDWCLARLAVYKAWDRH
ncbi:hypothetical protein GGS23DRAFT_427255 [Durotheca rogersii]|uniref:uncharacterized protein n=1 Tax=Durotheca rogersii TaxID=419775 RepID=UPI00221FB341|nr:uncharacterized protein GGS23DRAFT_427255 [Durotheca rogersii]KAI5865450.1 hypothetical protein GGS23DRAFT_427255 [Durotheca rogersii]